MRGKTLIQIENPTWSKDMKTKAHFHTHHKSRMVPLISLTCIVTSEVNKVHLFLECHSQHFPARLFTSSWSIRQSLCIHGSASWIPFHKGISWQCLAVAFRPHDNTLNPLQIAWQSASAPPNLWIIQVFSWARPYLTRTRRSERSKMPSEHLLGLCWILAGYPHACEDLPQSCVSYARQSVLLKLIRSAGYERLVDVELKIMKLEKIWYCKCKKAHVHRFGCIIPCRFQVALIRHPGTSYILTAYGVWGLFREVPS